MSKLGVEECHRYILFRNKLSASSLLHSERKSLSTSFQAILSFSHSKMATAIPEKKHIWDCLCYFFLNLEVAFYADP